MDINIEPTNIATMNLLNVLPEVIESCVLPYLPWNDLLRFRLVCQTTRKIVNDYIKVHSDLAPEIEIRSLKMLVESYVRSTNQTLNTYIKLGLSSIKVFLVNKRWSTQVSFYQQYWQHMELFLSKYGELIKHLRVKTLSLYCDNMEKKFLNGLVNLESFEAEEVVPFQFWIGYRAGIKIVPEMFERLRCLKLGMCYNAKQFPEVLEALEECLKTSKMLERIYIPFALNRRLAATNLSDLLCTVRKAFKDQSGIKSNLKVIDFAHINIIPNLPMSIRQEFLQLCYICASNKIMLDNVHTKWAPDIRHYYNLSTELPVVSTIGVWDIDMPYLQKIEINSVEQCFEILLNKREQDYTRPNWPKLNSLTLNMSTSNRTIINGVDCGIESVIRFFFEGIRRENMKKLRFIFPISNSMKFTNEMIDVLVNGCPHLKKLTLEKWNGTKELFRRLKKGLPELKQVSFTTF